MMMWGFISLTGLNTTSWDLNSGNTNPVCVGSVGHQVLVSRSTGRSLMTYDKVEVFIRTRQRLVHCIRSQLCWRLSFLTTLSVSELTSHWKHRDVFPALLWHVKLHMLSISIMEEEALQDVRNLAQLSRAHMTEGRRLDSTLFSSRAPLWNYYIDEMIILSLISRKYSIMCFLFSSVCD